MSKEGGGEGHGGRVLVGSYMFSIQRIGVPWTRREISGYVTHIGMWVDVSAERSLFNTVSNFSSASFPISLPPDIELPL